MIMFLPNNIEALNERLTLLVDYTEDKLRRRHIGGEGAMLRRTSETIVFDTIQNMIECEIDKRGEFDYPI